MVTEISKVLAMFWMPSVESVGISYSSQGDVGLALDVTWILRRSIVPNIIARFIA